MPDVVSAMHAQLTSPERFHARRRFTGFCPCAPKSLRPIRAEPSGPFRQLEERRLRRPLQLIAERSVSPWHLLGDVIGQLQRLERHPIRVQRVMREPKLRLVVGISIGIADPPTLDADSRCRLSMPMPSLYFPSL